VWTDRWSRRNACSISASLIESDALIIIKIMAKTIVFTMVMVKPND